MRTLSKSRFKLALSCPAKLYYTGKAEYANQSIDDLFLEALAEGGYQVGELAKYYFPGGVFIDDLNYDSALKKTNELLQREKVIIYEAAFAYENYFIRADILVKNGSSVNLYEVKAKSYDEYSDGDFIRTKKDIEYIDGAWKEYIYDAAFQKQVIMKARPEYAVRAFLMLADKNALAGVDGLNQKFLITRNDSGRIAVKIKGDVTPEALGVPILRAVSVDGVLDLIYRGEDREYTMNMDFMEYAAFLADHYVSDTKIPCPVGSHCKSCEFMANEDELREGMRCGYRECWKEKAGFSDKDFSRDTVLDLWDFRKKDDFIGRGKYFFSDLEHADILTKSARESGDGLSRVDRQWLQVQKSIQKDLSPYIDREGLASEFSSWRFPLHFIDFETTAVAIPFNRGRRPYEGVAFQFSHHVVHEDGTVIHQGEYINSERGVFPNYDFMRALKRELENDNGTIFRYATHENTYCSLIYRQLGAEAPGFCPDSGELRAFIQSITTYKGDNTIPAWEGERSMVDLCELVKKYYYSPRMGGSNSIKVVLPAVLNESEYLKIKYSQPIYGASGGIKSLNYRDKQWIHVKEGIVLDPYKTLEPVFPDYTIEDYDRFVTNDQIADGGAAMMAYARMQFSEMGVEERDLLRKALLRYCELDTLAMVMIYEYWKDLVKF